MRNGLTHIALPLRPGKRHFFGKAINDLLKDSTSKVTKEKQGRIDFPADKVFKVIADVGRYSEFVPFCTHSRVLQREHNKLQAELTVGFSSLLGDSYTSEVTLEHPKRVKTLAVDSSIFKRIESEWWLEPMGRSCQVSLKVRYQLRHSFHASLMHSVFDDVAHLQMDAFRKRCVDQYADSIGSASANEVEGGGSESVTEGTERGSALEGAAVEGAAESERPEAVESAVDLTSIFNSHAQCGRLHHTQFHECCTDLQLKYPHLSALSTDFTVRSAAFMSLAQCAAQRSNSSNAGIRSLEQDRYLLRDEFCVGVRLMATGSVAERARYIYQMMDTNHDGQVDEQELATALARKIEVVQKVVPLAMQHEIEEAEASLDLSAHERAGLHRAFDQSMRTVVDMVAKVHAQIPDATKLIFQRIQESDARKRAKQAGMQSTKITMDEWLKEANEHPEIISLSSIDGVAEMCKLVLMRTWKTHSAPKMLAALKNNAEHTDGGQQHLGTRAAPPAKSHE
jgi:coenzyme Q-binding protein COQ10